MSQFDFGNLGSPLPGADFIDDYLEPWRDALHTSHSGSSAPSYVQSGMLWIDTATSPWVLKVFDGSSHVAVGYINATTHAYLSANISSAMLPVTQATTLANARTSLGVYSKTETYSTTEVTNALALKANLASPTFTGTPTLPTGATAVTQTSWNNTTKIATTEYADTQDTYTRSVGLGGSAQSVQNVASSRVIGTTYTNTSGNPLLVTFNCTVTNSPDFTAYVDGIAVLRAAVGGAASCIGLSFIVPNGSTYLVFRNTGTSELAMWTELRT